MLFMVCLLFMCLPTSARPRAHRRSADTVTLVGRMLPAQRTLVHPDCPRSVASSYTVAAARYTVDLRSVRSVTGGTARGARPSLREPARRRARRPGRSDGLVDQGPLGEPDRTN